MPRVLFVTSSVTGNQVTRSYPFANLISNSFGNHAEIIGEGEPSKRLYIPTSDLVPISAIPSLNITSKIAWLREKIDTFDTVCVSKPCWNGTLSALIADTLNKRLVFDIDDNDLAAWFFDLRSDWRHVGLRSKFRHMLSGPPIILNFSSRFVADEVIVASKALARIYGGKVIYPPLDLKNFPDFEIHGSHPIIMYCGAVRAHKGLDTLIEAFELVHESVPDSRLDIIGPVDKGWLTKRQIIQKSRGMKNIHFLGWKPMKEIPRWLSRANCLVIPNPDNPIHRSQTPVKLMYYMASGRPIVATSVGEVPDILQNRVNGLIVKPGNPEAMSKAIVEIIESDRLSKSLGKCARNTYQKLYSAEAVKSDILQIFGCS